MTNRGGHVLLFGGLFFFVMVTTILVYAGVTNDTQTLQLLLSNLVSLGGGLAGGSAATSALRRKSE